MATLRSWKTVINNAITAFKSGKYVYFYGAKDIVLTEENMNYLMAAEPTYFDRYNNEEKKQIIRNSLGKIGVDCSGFVGWVCTGDKQWSTGQINNCSKYTSVKDGVTGSILYTTWGGKGRHIGLDIGNGYCLQAGYESTDANIKAGRAGIFLSPIGNTAWEKSGESRVVNYTGAYSPYEPTTKLIEEYTQPSKTPQWVAEATGLIDVRTEPVIKNNIFGKPKNALPQWPQLGKGNLVDVCDTTYAPGWSYVRIAGKCYGWVESKYLQKPNTKELAVGDKIRFIGKTLYMSSYPNSKGVSVPKFSGKIVQINQKEHPYLIRANNNQYEGWANKQDIEREG